MPERCSQIAQACVKHLQRLAAGSTDLAAAQYHEVRPPGLQALLCIQCLIYNAVCRLSG